MKNERETFLYDLIDVADELENHGEIKLAESIRNFRNEAIVIFSTDKHVGLEKIASTVKDSLRSSEAIGELVKQAGILDSLSQLWQGARAAWKAEGVINKVVGYMIGSKSQEFSNELTDKFIEKSNEMSGSTLGLMDVARLIGDAIKDITPDFINKILGGISGMLPGDKS